MIDFLYSRVMIAITSVAIASLVAMASMGMMREDGNGIVESLAESIERIVADLSNADADYLEQSLSIDRNLFPDSLEVNITGMRISVSDGFKQVSIDLQTSVIIKRAGLPVSEAMVKCGMTIRLISEKVLFEKHNRVTVDVLG